jgi:hypothetical protein
MEGMGKRWASMQGAFGWLGSQFWRWEVVAIMAPSIYGAGIGALYGDDYIVAATLFFAGIAWITAKVLSWEETRAQPNRRGISILILLFGVAGFGASAFWISHRIGDHLAEKAKEENPKLPRPLPLDKGDKQQPKAPTQQPNDTHPTFSQDSHASKSQAAGRGDCGPGLSVMGDNANIHNVATLTPCGNGILVKGANAKVDNVKTAARPMPLVPPTQKPATPAQPVTPVMLTGEFTGLTPPALSVYNPSEDVVEGVDWAMVVFRSSDLCFFSFPTQNLGYIKSRSKTLGEAMDLATMPKNAMGCDGSIREGDELTGSVSIDCPHCSIQTYIIHLVWKKSGWYYESDTKGGYILPKDASDAARQQYIQVLTGEQFASKRIEIRPQ